jgi:Tfp pilus assembly protein PilV
LRSLRHESQGKRAGFTLLEALVAFALIVAFAGALGPYLFHARRIMAGADGRIAAQLLLRSLLAAPLPRAAVPEALREGESAGLRWRVSAEPIFIDALLSARQRKSSRLEQRESSAPERPAWTAFRLMATVWWGAGRSVSADTVRLAKPE